VGDGRVQALTAAHHLGRVHSADVHVGPAGGAEHGADKRLVAEGVGPGAPGRFRRQGARHRLHRLHHERPQLVGVDRLPADERQPPARLQRRAAVGEGGRRVVEEHDAEARHGEGEVTGREGVGLGVGHAPDHVGEPGVGGPSPHAGDHHLAQVERQHPAFGAHRPRQCQGGGAEAAPDVEGVFARTGAGRRLEGITVRLEHHVEPLLVGHPAGPAVLVPEAGLILVGHARSLAGMRETRQ
jgi:hypothetical protein